MKKMLSAFLSMAFVFSFMSIPAFAAELNGTCHTAHDAACGYVPEEQPCTHFCLECAEDDTDITSTFKDEYFKNYIITHRTFR